MRITAHGIRLGMVLLLSGLGLAGCQQLIACPVTQPLMRGLGQIAEGSWYTRHVPPPATAPTTKPAPVINPELVKGQ